MNEVEALRLALSSLKQGSVPNSVIGYSWHKSLLSAGLGNDSRLDVEKIPSIFGTVTIPGLS